MISRLRPFKKLMRGVPASALPKAFTRPVLVPDDPYLVSSMVEDFVKTDRLDDAIFLMFEATKKIKQPVVPWNILLTHVTNQKKMKLATKLFQEMKVRGVKPNERTYLIMVSGCANSASVKSSDQAEQFLAEMKSKAAKDAEAVLRDSTLKASWKSKQGFPGNNLSDLVVQDERKDLRVIGEPSILHYNNLLKVYSRKDQPDKMFKLYEAMRTRAKIPDHKYFPDRYDNAAVAPVKPDIVTYTIVVNNLALLRTDEGFRKALTIWEDLREDADRRLDPKANLAFDERFLEALVKASTRCKDLELRYKGLELIDQSYGLRLRVNYPTSASYAKLPTLCPRELSQLSPRIQENQRLPMLDFALCTLNSLGLHHLVPDAFFGLVKPDCPFEPVRIAPDIRCFAIVLASIRANAKASFDSVKFKKDSTKFNPQSKNFQATPDVSKPLAGHVFEALTLPSRLNHNLSHKDKSKVGFKEGRTLKSI